MTAEELRKIDEALFRKWFEGPTEELNYVWSNFQGLPEFFEQTAQKGLGLVLTIF